MACAGVGCGGDGGGGGTPSTGRPAAMAAGLRWAGGVGTWVEGEESVRERERVCDVGRGRVHNQRGAYVRSPPPPPPHTYTTPLPLTQGSQALQAQ